MFSIGAKAVMGTGTKILIGLAITGWLALYAYGQHGKCKLFGNRT